MAIKIVIDSASDVSVAEAEAMGLIRVPLTVTFGDDVYVDGVDITPSEFFEKLIESDTLPKTSAINPDTYIEAIRPYAENGDTVIILALTSLLSGTYQSACIAAGEFPGKVYVVDTENVCAGERLLAMRALEMIEEGMNEQEIIEAINVEKKKVRVMAVLDTLEYLKKGGRISAATAFAGTVLNIKPVIAIANGVVELIGKARGSKNGNNFLRKQIAEGNGIDFTKPYTTLYSGLSDHMVRKYIADCADLWEGSTDNVPVCQIGAVIGTHAGPGAIGVAYFEK